MSALVRFAFSAVAFLAIAQGGINWKAVWLEPHNVVLIRAGDKQPYIVMGLNGANVTADLTKSPYLHVSSSNADVLEVDQKDGMFVGKKQGEAEIRISFSEATALVRAEVR